MTWDFAEANPFSKSIGNWLSHIERAYEALTAFRPDAPARVTQQDARTCPWPPDAAIATDPPYYNNINYADISDFFYVWLKRNLKDIYPDLFRTIATPKADELVADRRRHGGRQEAEQFFLTGISQAIAHMARHQSPNLPATLFYAFKQQEIKQDGIQSPGWSTFLQAIIDAGYAITGTWPMRTELANRMTGQNQNALASSVVLVCRPRPADAPLVTRANFLHRLKQDMPPALARLTAANTSPADMAQCAIGPAMALFTQAAKVINADDSLVDAKEALRLINAELDAYLGDIPGEFDSATRTAIAWYELHGTHPGPFGSADPLARAKDISIDHLHAQGIVEARAGQVRLRAIGECSAPPDPEEAPLWACLMHLLHLHEQDGVSDPAVFYARALGSRLEAAKDLAYTLYQIAETKRKAPAESRPYNAFVADYTELTAEAARADPDAATRQGNLWE